MQNSFIDNFKKFERSLSVSVKLSHDEVDRIVINQLIEIRNAEINKTIDTSYIDKTIRWFLSDEEFQKYVIEKQEIEY